MTKYDPSGRPVAPKNTSNSTSSAGFLVDDPAKKRPERMQTTSRDRLDAASTLSVQPGQKTARPPSRQVPVTQKPKPIYEAGRPVDGPESVSEARKPNFKRMGVARPAVMLNAMRPALVVTDGVRWDLKKHYTAIAPVGVVAQDEAGFADLTIDMTTPDRITQPHLYDEADFAPGCESEEVWRPTAGLVALRGRLIVHQQASIMTSVTFRIDGVLQPVRKAEFSGLSAAGGENGFFDVAQEKLELKIASHAEPVIEGPHVLVSGIRGDMQPAREIRGAVAIFQIDMYIVATPVPGGMPPVLTPVTHITRKV